MAMVLVRKSDKMVVKTVGDGARVEQKDEAVGPRLRVDGAQPGWEDDDYALVALEPLVVPSGKCISGDVTRVFDESTGKVVETATLEDVPLLRVKTSAEKVSDMLKTYGLTLDDLKTELSSGTKA